MVFENCLHSVLLRFSSNLMLSFFQLVSLLSLSHIYKSTFLNSRYSFLPDCLSMTLTLYTFLNSIVRFCIGVYRKVKNRWNLSKISKQYYESIPESFIFFGNAYLNLISISAIILQPTMLFSLIMR